MYKKDKRYIVGAVLTAASLLILAVTFVLMGMGSDKAVVWTAQSRCLIFIILRPPCGKCGKRVLPTP